MRFRQAALPRVAAPLRLYRTLHRAVLHPLLGLLLPACCLGCDRPLGPRNHLGACAACWAGLGPVAGPLCASCGLTQAPGTDLLGPAAGRCAACLLDPWPLGGVRPAVAYDDLARRFLLRAKLAGRRELLAPLGRQLALVLVRSGFAGGCDGVLAVPSAPAALLRRGFNPALEIARVVARRLALPLERRLLARRLRAGEPLKRMTAPQRRRRAGHAFRARAGAAGRRLLLIDDVLTTGATAVACARALRDAGALEVRLGVWARTPRPPGGAV